MLPKWLIAAHLRRQGWGRQQVQQPDIVYQLSLRLGASYSATCWALLSQSFLDRANVERLVKVEPKVSKQRAVPDITPEDWHRDVWLVSEKDRGAKMLGSPADLIVLALDEHVAGGYTWDVDVIAQAGMVVERDGRVTPDETRIGGPVQRRLVLQGEGKKHLHLEERRAWDKSQPSRNSFDIDLTLVGREPEGIPRSGRVLAA